MFLFLFQKKERIYKTDPDGSFFFYDNIKYILGDKFFYDEEDFEPDEKKNINWVLILFFLYKKKVNG